MLNVKNIAPHGAYDSAYSVFFVTFEKLTYIELQNKALKSKKLFSSKCDNAKYPYNMFWTISEVAWERGETRFLLLCLTSLSNMLKQRIT